ncbi:MAG: phenylalanine--tRNA ligase subunit beta, partial [Pyrinomonadaceae bacterium]
SIITLDGVKRELDEEMLVIADAARGVAIGGVMGGENSEISAETKNVLIESALFKSESIRRTVEQLGLQSEAAYRFARGVDPETCLSAIDRAVDLICEIAGGTATNDAIDVYPGRKSQVLVSLRPERVEQIAALGVDEADSDRILFNLGFLRQENSKADKGKRDYLVPSWRFDVQIEEDLVEEIARHVGYEKIETHLPASVTIGAYQKHESRKRAARQSLSGFGFSEAINFSFTDSSYDDLFDLLPGLNIKGQHQFLTLANPIIEGFNRMRPTLLSGLLDAIRSNLNHGTRNVKLFEIGRIFAKHEGEFQEGELPQECESLGLVATGSQVGAGRGGVRGELNFYDVKGALEVVAEAMNISPFDFTPGVVRHLSSGQSSVVSLEGRSIGSFGRLNEEIAAAFKFKQPVFVAELDLGAIEEASQMPIRYRPLSRFPSVMRDLSLLIDRQIK